MKRTESSSVSVWILEVCFCWSTPWATDPVRCMTSPGGAPEVAKVDRSWSTARVAAADVFRDGRSRSTVALRARPLADTPWSVTAVTRGTPRTDCSARSMAVLSAAVSGPVMEAATKVASERARA